MYVDNAVALTSTGKILTVGTAQAPVTEVIITNTAAKPVYVRPWSVGETAIAATAATGAKVSTGATPFRFSHMPTEPGVGYFAVSIITTATGACRIWAR